MSTAHAPCALRALRPEDAPVRLLPLYVRAAPSLAAEAIMPTLYAPEEFAALYHADQDRALALVAAMTEPQRVRQALAYAAWMAYHGLEIDLATVLAWEQA
jgi:hypothetical protein